jgi:glutamate dehydrogenase (NADP+)
MTSEFLNPTRWLCTADPCGAPGNYVVGANVAAFTRVADAMLALGMV